MNHMKIPLSTESFDLCWLTRALMDVFSLWTDKSMLSDAMLPE